VRKSAGAGDRLSRRTYLDTDVLLAAARATNEIHQKALAIIDDPQRVFVSGIASKLEVIPVPQFHRRADEVEFYETFYEACIEMVPVTNELCEAAFEEAKKCGMGGMDAVHVICASEARADELVTGEVSTKAIHRTRKVSVTSLRE
jgi:predicted nucleic acid-binding protein